MYIYFYKYPPKFITKLYDIIYLNKYLHFKFYLGKLLIPILNNFESKKYPNLIFNYKFDIYKCINL